MQTCEECGKETNVVYLTEEGLICSECMDKKRKEILINLTD